MVKRSSSKKKRNYESLAPACDTTFDLISTFFPANLIDGFQSSLIRTFLDLNRFLKSDKGSQNSISSFRKVFDCSQLWNWGGSEKSYMETRHSKKLKMH